MVVTWIAYTEMSVTWLKTNRPRNAPAIPLTAITSGSAAARSPPNTTSSRARTTGREINSAFFTSCWARSPSCLPRSSPPLTWTSGASIRLTVSTAVSVASSSASSLRPPSKVTGMTRACPSRAVRPGVVYGSGTSATPAISRTSATVRSTWARRAASETASPATTAVTDSPVGSMPER